MDEDITKAGVITLGIFALLLTFMLAIKGG